jgi:TusA-related sulfurtransferase
MTSASTSHCSIQLNTRLSEQDQQLLAQLLPLTPVTMTTSSDTLPVVAVVDGRGLACPLPLLKTKVALRSVGDGEALYVVATDPNSTADIAAFCRQSGAKTLGNTASAQLELRLQYQSDGKSMSAAEANDSSAETVVSNNAAEKGSADTLFHFIITKTDSNCA